MQLIFNKINILSLCDGGIMSIFPTEFRFFTFFGIDGWNCFMKFAFLFGWNRNFRRNFSIFIPDVNENVWPVDPQGLEESIYIGKPNLWKFPPNPFYPELFYSIILATNEFRSFQFLIEVKFISFLSRCHLLYKVKIK